MSFTTTYCFSSLPCTAARAITSHSDNVQQCQQAYMPWVVHTIPLLQAEAVSGVAVEHEHADQCQPHYMTQAQASLHRSLTSKSVPAYGLYSTLSPTETVGLTTFPLSSALPLPTATTCTDTLAMSDTVGNTLHSFTAANSILAGKQRQR